VIALAAVTLIVPCLGQRRDWATLVDPKLIRREFKASADGLSRGHALNKIWPIPQKPSVAEIVVGGVARSYQGEMVDLMGLNNVAMGHSKGDRRGMKNHAAFDPEIFFQLAPDLVVPLLLDYGVALNPSVASASIGKVNALDSPWLMLALKGLPEMPKFRAKYVAITLARNDPNESLALQLWCKRSKIDEFRRQGLTVIPFVDQ
jgi:hypothetical protein